MTVIGLQKFTCLFCGSEHPGYVTSCPETSERLDRAHKMEGTRLDGKYNVGAIIAEGGMGVVYEGTHAEIGRKVAIKFLHHLAKASDQMLERFRNEARIAAAVGHENIVHVLDMGTTGGNLPYIVMEYLEGNDLATFLEAADRLPQQWAVDITIQILSALKAVHSKGVVHRDLKPANIFLVTRPDGAMIVKLLDFGISRLKHGKGEVKDLTRTGAVLGTPHYMPPEQARGARDIDHRADLYSVGIILYRLLTGSFPFDAEDYNNLIIAITTEKPVHVGKHMPALPAGLQAVVMWSISRDPADRFADADEFIEALLPYRELDPDVMDDDSIPDGRAPDSPSAVGWGQPTPSTERPRRTFDEPSIHDVPTAPPPAASNYPPAAQRSTGGLASPPLALHVPGETSSREPAPKDSLLDEDRMTFPSIEIMAHTASLRDFQVAPTAPPPAPGAAAAPSPARSHGDTSSGVGWVQPAPDPTPPRAVDPTPNGWEQSSSRHSLPADPRNQTLWTRVRVQVPFMMASVALVTMVGGFTLFLAWRTQQLEMSVRGMTSHAASPVLVKRSDPAPVTVTLEGAPLAAEVYVDGVLHPERPLLIAPGQDARWIKVVAEGHESWENRVAIVSDVTIRVRMKPASSGGE